MGDRHTVGSWSYVTCAISPQWGGGVEADPDKLARYRTDG
jgi:hypothetical protein